MRWGALLAAMVAALPAAAQDEGARDRAVDLATIVAAHELCGFALSDAQEDAIIRKRQALLDAGALDPAELGAIEANIAAALKRQVPEGLCKPDGAEAHLYRRLLGTLGVD